MMRAATATKTRTPTSERPEVPNKIARGARDPPTVPSKIAWAQAAFARRSPSRGARDPLRVPSNKMIDVIVNPLSRANRRDPRIAADFQAIVGDRGRVLAPKSLA